MSQGSGAPASDWSVDEALAYLLQAVEAPAPEPVELEQALGLVLAEPLVSAEMHPSDDTSAMDGYAVRAYDLRRAGPQDPVRLRQVEDIRAGWPPEVEVGDGQCARISTGGLIPIGADAVEMREFVEVDGDQVVFTRPVAEGANIRWAGEHLQIGDEVLSVGTVISSAELGMAAYLGADRLRCYPSLPVAVLATGSELVDGGPLQRGQVRDSNGVALASAVRQLGCPVVLRERVADEVAALDQAIARAKSQAKVLLTSGGISAGWHDLVRQRIEESGGTFHFHRLRMRPGKPIAFGRLGAMWVFCLPGNPVSSLVTFEVFVKPCLLKMMGRSWRPRVVKARLREGIRKKAGLTVFFRVRLEPTPDGQWTAQLSGPQGSHQLRSLVAANGLLVAGEAIEELAPGAEVEVRWLRDEGSEPPAPSPGSAASSEV